jgi:hypothetical protein
MIKNTNTCPAGSEWYEENAVSSRFAELNMSSRHMSTAMIFRLNKTPISPMLKSATLSII